MKIGIIGSGAIGGTVGRLLVGAAHDVCFSSSHPEELEGLVEELGKHAHRGSVQEAAEFGDALFCAAPYGVWPTLAPEIAPYVDGKALLDAANPYPDRDGEFASQALASGDGSGVQIQALLPTARYVRAFNSVEAGMLETQAHRDGDRIGIPLAGDDKEALHLASELVRECGFDPVVVGNLKTAAKFDNGTDVYTSNMTGVELAKALGVGHPLLTPQTE